MMWKKYHDNIFGNVAQPYFYFSRKHGITVQTTTILSNTHTHNIYSIPCQYLCVLPFSYNIIKLIRNSHRGAQIYYRSGL